MAMICMECGNTEEFRQGVSGTKYVYGTRTIDGESESETDIDETDEEDTEWNDENDLTCVECENGDIQEGLSEKEISQLIWEHTDKEGDWDEEELDEGDRDKELGDKLITDNL